MQNSSIKVCLAFNECDFRDLAIVDTEDKAIARDGHPADFWQEKLCVSQHCTATMCIDHRCCLMLRPASQTFGLHDPDIYDASLTFVDS